MLGPTANGRLMGPGIGSSSGSAVSHHRNLGWPSAAASSSSRSFEFQTSNGEVTESLFAAGGYNTPPASSPFLSCSPLELVAKNFHSTGAAVTFSQANSSIFVQSQTDFINGTTAVAKKTETCIGRWEHGTLEPLQIQIKREPCQVSEVTTSNNYEASTTTALTAVVKLEVPSPKAAPCSSNSGTAMDHIGITSTQNNAAATIPVGIAVARQRLQESTNACGPGSQLHHQAKELNRFGLAATGSTADLGCTTPSLSQNMFFTGTNSTMIPLSSEAVTMGVTNAAAAAAAAAVQNAVRTPPALWQYPAPLPMESMLPMPPMPPVGFQLVRDPSTGQILFLPTTTTIEPFPQTVVWPSYPQSTAAIQPPHLLLPQMSQQQLQPPPLAPLQMLSSDYLATASSTTLHQQQHTQTHHSTRYVALTSDNNKRSNNNNNNSNSNKSTSSSMPASCHPSIPMPIPSHTFIKIEDCSGTAASMCNNSTQIFPEQEKTIQTATIATSPDIAPQLLFQQGNLIQITPSAKTTASLLEPPAIVPAIATANPITPPPSTVSAAVAPSPHQPELPGATCLTPPPDQSICQNEDVEAPPAPEVQDANIQTDTPIMSEDDNTVGTDDGPHQQDASTLTLSTNPSEEPHFPHMFSSQPSIVPTQLHQSTEMLCHSIINNSGDSAIEPDMSTHSSSGTSLNLSNTSSTNCDHADAMEAEDNAIPSTVSAPPTETTQPLTVNANCGLRIPKLEMLSPVENPVPQEPEEYHPTVEPSQQEHPVDLSGLELLSRSIEVFQKKASMIKKEPISPQLPPESPQLLPLPPLIPCEPPLHRPTIPEIDPQPSTPQPAVPTNSSVPPSVADTFIRNDEPMVGLNLLCALAEQRFQEEGMFKKDSPAANFSPSMSPVEDKLDQSAESSSPPQTMPPQAASPEIPSRKRKHKHSKDSRKSSKKSKHDKEQRRERKRKHSSDANEEDEIDGELKQSFSRIKAKLEKCGCSDANENGHQCRSKTTWPSTANELFSVIESDMKERLVNITRQCEEKKRELEQMSTTSVAKVKPLTAMVRIPDIGKSYFGGFSSSSSSGLINGSSSSGTTSSAAQAQNLLAPKLSTIPALSPNFSSSSNSTTFVELPKLSSDTDSSKQEDVDSNSIERLSFSKRKGGIPKKHDDIALTETIVAKKPKSLVGYILASKNRMGDSNVKESGHHKSSHHHHHHHSHRQQAGSNTATSSKQQPCEVKQKKSPIHSSKFESTTSDDTSNLSDSSTKAQIKIKSPTFSFEDENSKPSDAAFSIFGGKPSIFDKVKTSPISSTTISTLKMSPVQAVVAPMKHHHSKHKKSRSKERKRRSSEKKRIDLKCLLTSDYLNQNKTRVLTAMGGLFYAGCLSAVQPPDIYAVTLDGERGNRPHIMSREEVLRDAILEVAPKTVEEIIPGTRLCAYWSQQYRCLYPGVAAEPTSPDPEKRYINVEFDDGDSGRIALEDIRFLLSDYPIVEYDPNPLLSLGKRKRQPSVSEVGTTSTTTTTGITAASVPLAATTSSTTTITTTNCFAMVSDRTDKRVHDEAYREERRRLKKIRKDKLRRLAANNAELSSHKHKKKSKCNDEYCKHRKHKKRRKHKKHHREHDVPSSPDPAAAGSMDDDISQGDSASQAAGPFSPASVVDVPIAEDKADEKEVFNPSLKEDTLTENEEASSSITESSGSYYQPKKSSTEKSEKRQSTENNSKIAAFLPARQLWAWCGKGYRRSTGRVKKQFYKSIQRGKETISVGDSAVFLSTGRPDRPYIGHIESMWETSTNNMVVRVKWFYHPEETEGCPNLKYPGALFQSPHEDENDVQTISHKCEVLALAQYIAKFGADPKQYSAIYDNNDTYYLAGYYDPTVITIKIQPEIEILPGEEKWVRTD